MAELDVAKLRQRVLGDHPPKEWYPLGEAELLAVLERIPELERDLEGLRKIVREQNAERERIVAEAMANHDRASRERDTAQERAERVEAAPGKKIVSVQEALAQPCPECGVPGGRPCRMSGEPGRPTLDWPHGARRRRAAAAAAVTCATLSERQMNLLSAAVSMLASAAQPTRRLPRERQHVYDDHVAGWFNRRLAGTRTPDPATHDELMELWRGLNRARSIVVEAPETTDEPQRSADV